MDGMLCCCKHLIACAELCSYAVKKHKLNFKFKFHMFSFKHTVARKSRRAKVSDVHVRSRYARTSRHLPEYEQTRRPR